MLHRIWCTFSSILMMLIFVDPTVAWIIQKNEVTNVVISSRKRTMIIHSSPNMNNEYSTYDATTTEVKVRNLSMSPRREFLQEFYNGSLRALVGGSLVAAGGHGLLHDPDVCYAEVVRAVGSGEIECRAAGNCLETGELDGAIGWEWGAKNRCDPSNPKCGTDGRLRENDIVGKPVPRPNSDITHVAAIKIEIGRGEDGIIRLGLYGKDCPASVEQLLDFLSETGFITLDERNKQNMIGMVSEPLSLTRGGVVDAIVPNLTVDFGIPSQSYAYARSRGISKAGDNFIVQPRPKSTITSQDGMVRNHDAAGLLSVSNKGLGYGGTGFETDDEAFESSFLITADAVPALDKTRRVVGQVLDPSSMAFLERLVNLPTKRGIRGVIPGQTSGPPLLKVTVREVEVAKVTGRPDEKVAITN